MAFKVPEQFRINERIAKSLKHLGDDIISLINDDAVGNNGWFFLPRNKGGKGYFFLCKALQQDGWNCVVVVVPADGFRTARWEELFYISKHFWQPDDIVMMFFPGKEPFIANPGWVHMWNTEDPNAMTLPPIFDNKLHFKKAGFWAQLFRKVTGGLIKQTK
jgi:hypothetical protein